VGVARAMRREALVRKHWSLAITGAALCAAAWLGFASPPGRGQPARDGPVEREKLYLAGWDPDEPVPAYAYSQKGSKAMPVAIFTHGLGGSKENDGRRMENLARQGLFVVQIDAHLHGERKVPGIFPQGKTLGHLGDDYSIWVHQSAVSHTSRD